VQANGSNLMIN